MPDSRADVVRPAHPTLTPGMPCGVDVARFVGVDLCNGIADSQKFGGVHGVFIRSLRVERNMHACL
jgi:hypothetical protein